MIILRQHRGVRLANERYEEIKADIIDMFEECDVHTFPLNAFDIAEYHILLFQWKKESSATVLAKTVVPS